MKGAGMIQQTIDELRELKKAMEDDGWDNIHYTLDKAIIACEQLRKARKKAKRWKRKYMTFVADYDECRHDCEHCAYLECPKDDYQTDMDEAWERAKQAEYDKAYDDYLALVNADMKEPCEDAVSRQAVPNELTFIGGDIEPDDLTILFRDRIKQLPSVQPKAKTGHWSRKTKVDAYDIAGVKTWGIKCQCDRCDFTTIVVEDFGYYKYCPNCGAEMKGDTE